MPSSLPDGWWLARKLQRKSLLSPASAFPSSLHSLSCLFEVICLFPLCPVPVSLVLTPYYLWKWRIHGPFLCLFSPLTFLFVWSNLPFPLCLVPVSLVLTPYYLWKWGIHGPFLCLFSPLAFLSFEVICLFICVLVRPSLVSSFALSFCGNTGVSIFCTHNSHSQESNWFATTLIYTDNQQLQWKIDQELNSCHQQAVNTTNWNTHPTRYSTKCLVGGLLEALDLEHTPLLDTLHSGRITGST